jgi:hypothetical protein
MRKLRTEEDLEFATLSQVRKRLADKGLREPSKPELDLPPIPSELGDLPGEDIIELYGVYTGHYEWVTYSHTLAELSAAEWKNILEHKTAEFKLDNPDSDPRLDPELIELRRQVQMWEQESELLKAHKSALHRNMSVVSRAVEVLKIGAKASARAGNMGRSWD